MVMKPKNIKIVSDGTPANTHVSVNGHKINGIMAIEIYPIISTEHVRARFTVLVEELDMVIKQIDLAGRIK
jgi:hypothetical protein